MFYLIVMTRFYIMYSLCYPYFILLHINILALSYYILRKIRNNIIAKG